MKQRSRKLSIRMKIILSVIGIMVIVFGFLGGTSIITMRTNLIEMGGEQAQVAAGLALNEIDADALMKLKPGDEDGKLYNSIVEPLREMQKACGVKYLYTLTTDGNKVYSYVTNQNSTGIANAARIGLIKGRNTTSTLGGDARALSTIGGKAFMWEPNSDTHTANGIANGVSLGWINGNIAQVGAAPIAYAGLKAETAANSPVALSQITETGAPDLAKNITPTWTTKRDDFVSLQFPDTAKDGGYALNNGVTKFRIYMWVEGQDIDAENFASGSYLEYNLSFSLEQYRAAQGG